MRKKEMVKKMEDLNVRLSSLENKYYDICASYQIYVASIPSLGFYLSNTVEVKDVVSEIVDYLGLDIKPISDVPKKVKLIKREVKGA